jgi:hypothetical protein
LSASYHFTLPVGTGLTSHKESVPPFSRRDAMW